MSPQIRSFTSFCIFFLGTSLVFWPMIIVGVGLAAALPTILYWDADLLLNLEMLISGINLPEHDWFLIFLIPAFILGLPAIFSHYEGELMESQLDLYSFLIDTIVTPYGMIGWSLTAAILGSFLYFTLWCVKQTTGFSQTQTSHYIAILTLLLGGAACLI
jgi:hypothetical protein